MTSSDRTINYLLGAALGLSLALAPTPADAASAVSAEKHNLSVVGVAAGSEAATTPPAETDRRTRKKKKASKPVEMVAVPAETVRPATTAPQPAPVAAGAPAAESSKSPEPAPAVPQVSPDAAAETAAPQSSPAAPPAGAGAPGAAPTSATGAAVAASTAAEAAEPAPKKRRQLGMRPAEPRPAVAASAAAAAIARKDIIGVVPPTGRIAGRVLGKDGITHLAGAELILDHKAFGSEHRFVTDSSGVFDLELPIGQYDLTIQRRHEIYESPASYSIARRGTLPIDFILLRDFEPEPAAQPTGKGSASGGDVSAGNGVAVDDGSGRWLPEPRQEPQVVGSVVDLVSAEQEAPAGSRKNGAETLGFIGSLLIILIAL